MSKYVKYFLHRGLIFGGFGPIILGVIYAIISYSNADFSLSGKDVLIGIVSTYLLAFVQAGSSVFNQIEEWPLTKSLLCHFSSIYLAYVLCYIVNSWIPFEPMVIVVFSSIFAITYLIIWLTVYFIVKSTQKKLNSKIRL